MGIAIDVLRELYSATEPEKGITPTFKGRSLDKVKDGISPELRFMRLANKAVEDSLREFNKDKSGRKVEIHLLRIAQKVVTAAIIKAKAKTPKHPKLQKHQKLRKLRKHLRHPKPPRIQRKTKRR